MADFAAIKQQVTIEAAAHFLGLEMRKAGVALRGPCPACQTGGERALVITPSKQLFYCFSAGIGGDLITMWGHIEKCSLADAGGRIADTFGVEKGSGTSARSELSAQAHSSNPPQKEAAFDPEAFGAKLTYTPEVEALGFSKEAAQQFCIGFSRGKVYIPIRHADGSISGFVGFAGGELKLPPRWLPPNNIVPFGKKSA